MDTCQASFNGAAGLHQRKPNPPDESRVAPGRLQWGRWFTPAETGKREHADCSDASFNGAAGLHQRKHRRFIAAARTDVPLQWGRWFTPAETNLVFTATDGSPLLQWGRWFTPAETTPRRAHLLSVHSASMGPLVYTSGNHTCGSEQIPNTMCFNGAAGLHQRKLTLASA